VPLAAGAAALQNPMFGDLVAGGRQIEHLPTLRYRPFSSPANRTHRRLPAAHG
jgi:hypothetical protein